MSAEPSLVPPASPVDLIALEDTRTGVRVSGIAKLLMACAAPLIGNAAALDRRILVGAWIACSVSLLVSFSASYLVYPKPRGVQATIATAGWILLGTLVVVVPAIRIYSLLDGSEPGGLTLRIARYVYLLDILSVGTLGFNVGRLCRKAHLDRLAAVWFGLYGIAFAAVLAHEYWPAVYWVYVALGVLAFFLAQRTARDLWLAGLARHAKSFVHEGPVPTVEPLHPADEH
jgi:hypothetical protein